MTQYDSTADTQSHIQSVRRHMAHVAQELIDRATIHDQSKLESPEKEAFDRLTPRLKETSYGSDEYKMLLAEMGEALAHHYAHNSHHPEHYSNGIAGMSLLDLIEMFCDWKAAGERHGDDFAAGLEINRQRFAVDDQLAQILENTRKELGW